MYTGTCMGGGLNFNAVALEYGVMQNGGLYAGATAVDNAMTTLWMATCVALPRLLGLNVPSIVVLTTIALVLAQLPQIKRLRGVRLLGLFAVYLFAAVVGTL